MKRCFRLTRSTDFKRVRRIGKSYAHPLVVLVTAPGEEDMLRVGIVAGRSTGGAVQRNRIKRRLRAVMTSFIPRIKPGWDCIFYARQAVAQAAFDEVAWAIQSLLKRAGLFLSPEEMQEDGASGIPQ